MKIVGKSWGQVQLLLFLIVPLVIHSVHGIKCYVCNGEESGEKSCQDFTESTNKSAYSIVCSKDAKGCYQYEGKFKGGEHQGKKTPEVKGCWGTFQNDDPAYNLSKPMLKGQMGSCVTVDGLDEQNFLTLEIHICVCDKNNCNGALRLGVGFVALAVALVPVSGALSVLVFGS